MSSPVTATKEGQTLTARVPMVFRKRGGRKLIVAPDGNTWAPPRRRGDNAMVKAIGRVFRWRKLLETGVFTVSCEPVSGSNSLLTRKRTGNFAVLCSTRHKKIGWAALILGAWPILIL